MFSENINENIKSRTIKLSRSFRHLISNKTNKQHVEKTKYWHDTHKTCVLIVGSVTIYKFCVLLCCFNWWNYVLAAFPEDANRLQFAKRYSMSKELIIGLKIDGNTFKYISRNDVESCFLKRFGNWLAAYLK